MLRLRALDDVQRRHALQLHARMRGLELTGEVADFILSRFSRDLRDLVALIERLDEQALAAQRALTIPFVRGFVGAGSGRDS